MRRVAGLLMLTALGGGPAELRGETFILLTGVNANRYPGTTRLVSPIPGSTFSLAGAFNDGQRLAGLEVVDPPVAWQGSGAPLYQPNHVGAMSFFFRRGSIPLFANHVVPIQGIDFLGGPLLDLDGDLNNATRSLTPVPGRTPVEIPGSNSFIAFEFDTVAGTATLVEFDATGTNEGGPGVNPGAAVTVNILADGAWNGDPPGPINPAFDTRVGSLTAFTGTSATLTSVWRIDGVQAEFWYDSIDPFSSSPAQLGTFQQFERLGGWLVRRGGNGQFPALAGEGLGSTRWPAADTSVSCPPQDPCLSFNRAFDTGFGLTADITDGNPTDRYSEPAPTSALGLPLTAFGGDLGAYLDAVVVPRLGPQHDAFIYLESSGFGINNTGDPVFGNTIGYDLVVVAASVRLVGDVNGDGVVNAADATALVAALMDPSSPDPQAFQRADVNGDGQVDGRDIQAFVDALL